MRRAHFLLSPYHNTVRAKVYLINFFLQIFLVKSEADICVYPLQIFVQSKSNFNYCCFTNFHPFL